MNLGGMIQIHQIYTAKLLTLKEHGSVWESRLKDSRWITKITLVPFAACDCFIFRVKKGYYFEVKYSIIFYYFTS